MKTSAEIEKNIANITGVIAQACAKAKRDVKQVHILAVSKLQPIEKIEAAYHCGLRHFGENYVQELAEKREKLVHLKDIQWHLIGHLQSNKAKLAVESADFFHALDSEKLTNELEKKIISKGLTSWPVFIQMNICDEKTKSGIAISELEGFSRFVRDKSVFDLRGLMCIPEAKDSPEDSRAAFQKMLVFKKRYGFNELSMGMSDDFTVAIEEGANWVRIGRKIFGDRE